jgi:hypothetical protein
MTPEDVVEKTLGWHRLAVAKLHQHPTRLAIVRRNIETFKEKASPGSQHYIREWKQLFDAGPEQLYAVALEESEHANDLRQCSPFGGVLSDEERQAYFRAFKAEYDRRRSGPSP